MLKAHGLTTYIRDANLRVVAQLDDARELTVVPRHNRVGSWTMSLSAGSDKAALLDPKQGGANPGGGIQVYTDDGDTLMSGPITNFQWDRSGSEDNTGTLTINGSDDNVYLARWLVWPNPAAAITAQANPFRQVSGASTSVETMIRNLVSEQAGPTNHVSRQRIPFLSLPTSLNRGTATALRRNFRFETLIEAMADIAEAATTGLSAPANRGGIGFRLVQEGTQLVLRIFETVDRVETAKFSFENGTLADANYGVSAPNTSHLILGAGRTAAFTDGPQVAKNLVLYTRTDQWFPSVYAESFEDVGEINPADGDVSAQMQAAADQHFDTESGQVGISMTPIDTDSLQYFRDWQVGDFVTIELPYITLQERVREATITYGNDDILRATALVGTVDGQYARRSPGFLKRITDLTKLLKKKETTV